MPTSQNSVLLPVNFNALYHAYIYVLSHVTTFLIALPNGKSQFITEIILLEPHETSMPWFGTPLPSGAHPECKYEMWNEVTHSITHNCMYA